jgi:hypothetical protein
MILKTNSNPNFILSLQLNIDYDLKNIDILVILDNIKNHKREMQVFRGNELEKALQQYNHYEEFIF